MEPIICPSCGTSLNLAYYLKPRFYTITYEKVLTDEEKLSQTSSAPEIESRVDVCSFERLQAGIECYNCHAEIHFGKTIAVKHKPKQE